MTIGKKLIQGLEDLLDDLKKDRPLQVTQVKIVKGKVYRRKATMKPSELLKARKRK